MTDSDPTTLHCRRLVLEKDHESLAWLVERYSEHLYAVAWRHYKVLNAGQELGDVVQQAWLVLFREVQANQVADAPWLRPKPDSARAEGGGSYASAFVAHMTEIVRRTCLAAMRATYRARVRSASVDGEPPSAAPAQEHALRNRTRGILTRLGETETLDRLTRRLAASPALDREVLSLRYLEGLSFREIATLLEIEEATARRRCKDARDRFRDRWGADIAPEATEQ